ncbi:aquaporin Z [Fischerella sp. JS2]|uniref:aquaporin Z n=1 Tax=Fischerella sp. JS2 TaxID=2597771 RepID=UPI0028E59B11|nr:aquaporin Z [Fischerella sp. JS2]
MVSLFTRCLAEFIGTFVLVLGGCGSAVFAAAFPNITTNELGIGFVGVALAFGLTVLIMAYAVGHISGCHLNPAVSFGLWSGKRFPASELLPYIIAQVLGATVAAGLIYFIATGKPGFTLSGSNPLATNGFGVHSPGGYSLIACFITEIVLTFVFLIVILGATDGRAPKGFAPIAIGMALTLIHLISIPITNTSVNPARSTGPALFAGVEMFRQVWMFWVAPILGAILAGLFYSSALGESGVQVVGEAESGSSRDISKGGYSRR